MTTQSDKNEILVRVKGLQKTIALFPTDITGMKEVNKELEKYNVLIAEARNTKPSLIKLYAWSIMNY